MILGVCGYGYSGSGAAISLLKEFEGVKCLNNREVQEFTLSYISDGLEDLEFNIVSNPSKGTRCDIAIYRFKLLIDYYERSYNRFTGGHFREYTDEYLNNLIQVKWKGIRVFEYQRSWKRWVYFAKNKVSVFLRRFNINRRFFPARECYMSIFPESFEEYTRAYVAKLLGGNRDKECLLLDQPFSAGNPLHSMRFFVDPKCIVVDRDPRDLYVMIKHVYKSNASFIPINTIDNFIKYYKIVRDDRLWKGSSLIYRVQFEDLIYNYDSTIKGIENFVGPILGTHVYSKKYFDPAISIANTHVYPNYPEDAEAITKIEYELKDYLYDFSNDKIIKKNVNLDIFTYM